MGAVRTNDWEIDAAVEATRRVPEILEELRLPSNETALRRLLEELHIGSGQNAVAFLSPDEDFVLKIVFDPDQAALSKLARRKPTDGIVPVADVYVVGALTHFRTQRPAWVVIERAVVPIDKLEERAEELTGAAKRDAQRVLVAARWALNELLTEMVEGRPSKTSPWRPESKLKAAFLWDLRRARQWISRHAVDPSDVEWDLNESNIGFDPTTESLVVLDLGQTRVAGGTIDAAEE